MKGMMVRIPREVNKMFQYNSGLITIPEFRALTNAKMFFVAVTTDFYSPLRLKYFMKEDHRLLPFDDPDAVDDVRRAAVDLLSTPWVVGNKMTRQGKRLKNREFVKVEEARKVYMDLQGADMLTKLHSQFFLYKKILDEAPAKYDKWNSTTFKLWQRLLADGGPMDQIQRKMQDVVDNWPEFFDPLLQKPEKLSAQLEAKFQEEEDIELQDILDLD